MTLWAGRVEVRLAPEVWAFLRADDAELLPYDCEATLVHARRLARGRGSSPTRSSPRSRRALAAIAQGGYALLVDDDEDVHSAIERLLGAVGRKIHAGRSRNDQVAAAFRLYVADACAEAREAIAAFARAVLDLAEAEAGHRHARLHAPPARPAGHARPPPARLGRDARPRPRAASRSRPSRRRRARSAPGRSPARRCRCPRRPARCANSLDAVADRDFALDYLYAGAVLFVHLSRIGEELVLWSSSEFGFARLPEAAATGLVDDAAEAEPRRRRARARARRARRSAG